MNWWEKIAAKLEQYFVVPNLALILTLGSGLCFVFGLISPGFLPFIALVPERVVSGEFWRLLSFIFYPFDLHPIFAFFTYYLFYLMGTTLEHKWGHAKFNLYIFLGYLGTIAASFLTPHAIATNYYIYLSVYLAFAALFPDFTLYLFFVVPVKIKWIAFVIVGLTVMDFMGSDWSGRFAILVSAFNFLIFFGPALFQKARGGVQIMQTEIQVTQEESKPFHICEVCKKNDKTHPREMFRVSNGLEYCSEHLPSASSKLKS